MRYPKTRAFVRHVQELALQNPSAISDSDVRKLREIHSAAESGDVSLMEWMEEGMAVTAWATKKASAPIAPHIPSADVAGSFDSAQLRTAPSSEAATSCESSKLAKSSPPPVPKSGMLGFWLIVPGWFPPEGKRFDFEESSPNPPPPAPAPASEPEAYRRSEDRFEKEVDQYGRDSKAPDEFLDETPSASVSRATDWNIDSGDENPVEALNSIELLTASVLTRLQDRYVGS